MSSGTLLKTPRHTASVLAVIRGIIGIPLLGVIVGSESATKAHRAVDEEQWNESVEAQGEQALDSVHGATSRVSALDGRNLPQHITMREAVIGEAVPEPGKERGPTSVPLTSENAADGVTLESRLSLLDDRRVGTQNPPVREQHAE